MFLKHPQTITTLSRPVVNRACPSLSLCLHGRQVREGERSPEPTQKCPSHPLGLFALNLQKPRWRRVRTNLAPAWAGNFGAVLGGEGREVFFGRGQVSENVFVWKKCCSRIVVVER